MQHADHVELIRAGVVGAGPRWLELGAGDGEFTLALADVLGGSGDIVAVDLNRRRLAELSRRVSGRFPSTTLNSPPFAQMPRWAMAACAFSGAGTAPLTTAWCNPAAAA